MVLLMWSDFVSDSLGLIYNSEIKMLEFLGFFSEHLEYLSNF